MTSKATERALGQMDNLPSKRMCYKKSIFSVLVANPFTGSKPCENVMQLWKSISNEAFIVGHMVIAENLAYKKLICLPK